MKMTFKAFAKNLFGAKYEMIAHYGMNLGQMLSIPFIILGIALVVYAMCRPRQHWTFPDRFAPETEEKKR